MKYASRLVWLGCLAWIVQGTQAQAQQHQSGAGEALQLLQKVATAAHKVTYSGVFGGLRMGSGIIGTGSRRWIPRGP